MDKSIALIFGVACFTLASPPTFASSCANQQKKSYDSISPSIGGGIPVRNLAAITLTFHLFENASWKDYCINSGGEFEIPSTDIVLLIQTYKDSPPPKPSHAELPTKAGESVISPGNFTRRLNSGEKWILCWSSVNKLWVVDYANASTCKS